jgi:hypothetical protein
MTTAAQSPSEALGVKAFQLSFELAWFHLNLRLPEKWLPPLRE